MQVPDNALILVLFEKVKGRVQRGYMAKSRTEELSGEKQVFLSPLSVSLLHGV